MPDTVHRIPLAEIDDSALTRDRTGLDEAPLSELRSSIALNGLRMPVELWRLSEPRGPGATQRYGLLSGLRRLAAFRELHEMTGDESYAAIPAFLRAPGTLSEALAAMVEENEIRVGLSPWERGRIAWAAHRQEIFESIEEAVAKLFPAAPRMKRTRLRAIAHLVEELNSYLTAPERYSLRQLLRISNAVQLGFADVIRAALEGSVERDPETQWRLLRPILDEAEQLPDNTPKRPGYPRRVLRPRRGLTIRRERTRDGYTLHFTGEMARGGMLDAVFDEIERIFAPE